MKAQKADRDGDVAAEPMNRMLATRRLRDADVIDRRRVTVNLAESPLAWLATRGLVTRQQFDASERLRHDFMVAGQAPRVTMRWDPAPVSRSLGQVAAIQRRRRSWRDSGSMRRWPLSGRV